MEVMNKMSSIKGYLTITEAADLIGVDGSQVRRYCLRGILPAVKIGRAWLIKDCDVRRFERPPVGNPNLVRA